MCCWKKFELIGRRETQRRKEEMSYIIWQQLSDKNYMTKRLYG